MAEEGRDPLALRAPQLCRPREAPDGPILNLTWGTAGGWGCPVFSRLPRGLLVQVTHETLHALKINFKRISPVSPQKKKNKFKKAYRAGKDGREVDSNLQCCMSEKKKSR